MGQNIYRLKALVMLENNLGEPWPLMRVDSIVLLHVHSSTMAEIFQHKELSKTENEKSYWDSVLKECAKLY